MRFESRTLLEEASRKGISCQFFNDLAICRILGRIWAVCNKADKAIAHWLIREGFWEAWITCWMLNRIQPGWKVLDVGANLGYYSLILADHGCYVTAVEPQQENCDMLQASMLINKIHNIKIVPVALGNANGILPFHICVENNGCSGIVGADSQSISRHVQVIPLDSIEESFDFIKIDAEGGEYDIWYGGQEFFKRNPNVIIAFEWNAGRYKDPEAFAKDILQKCDVTIINYDGNEDPCDGVKQLVFFQNEVMLVLRFKK